MEYIQRLDKKPAGLLYHYTTIDGLLGIFRDEAIWATNISYLNDKEEFCLAANMFKNAIEGLRAELPSKEPDVQPDLGERFLNTLASIDNLTQLDGLALVDTPLSTASFICSFSEDGNQLSQWRSYCPGGVGFSIGFDHSELEKHMGRQIYHLAQCIYKKNEQEEFVHQWVKREIEPVLAKLTSQEVNYDTEIITSFLRLLRALPVLKHEKFKDEKEWRLIQSIQLNGRSIKFRAGKTTLIPYCEFQLTERKQNDRSTLLPIVAIKSIFIGPTPNKTESLYAVKALLGMHGMLNQVEVIDSNIPYREL